MTCSQWFYSCVNDLSSVILLLCIWLVLSDFTPVYLTCLIETAIGCREKSKRGAEQASAMVCLRTLGIPDGCVNPETSWWTFIVGRFTKVQLSRVRRVFLHRTRSKDVPSASRWKLRFVSVKCHNTWSCVTWQNLIPRCAPCSSWLEAPFRFIKVPLEWACLVLLHRTRSQGVPHVHPGGRLLFGSLRYH